MPDTVALMENYTKQAHALGLIVKFYYTIRELSNHAAELFALKALSGEVLLDEDPYTVPQKGYCPCVPLRNMLCVCVCVCVHV